MLSVREEERKTPSYPIKPHLLFAQMSASGRERCSDYFKFWYCRSLIAVVEAMIYIELL